MCLCCIVQRWLPEPEVGSACTIQVPICCIKQHRPILGNIWELPPELKEPVRADEATANITSVAAVAIFEQEHGVTGPNLHQPRAGAQGQCNGNSAATPLAQQPQCPTPLQQLSTPRAWHCMQTVSAIRKFATGCQNCCSSRPVAQPCLAHYLQYTAAACNLAPLPFPQLPGWPFPNSHALIQHMFHQLSIERFNEFAVHDI